jgi:mono/diheme cytochrome c family protein
VQRWNALLALVILWAPLTGQAAPPSADEFFEIKVRPLLAAHCYRCHGPDKQKGGLRLDSATALKKGGDSGAVVVPGKPKESLLIRAVNRQGPKMPPKETLRPEEVAALTRWVQQGAPWPKGTGAGRPAIASARQHHWAFRPVANPPVPTVRDRTWPLNAVDHFVLASQEARKLHPVAPADRRTLIRRATYDLTGLPPRPEEIEAFLADKSPGAWKKVVERLLASPAYGERWGRHWLDLVRYADTAGDNSDYPIPQHYRYRNWVILAFNNDRPYDQFLREQIAGDLLPAANEADRRDKIIATGYLANARRFGSYEDARYPWHLTIEDTIDNLGRTVLGLTINCCRCHDHKFDPLLQEDYYALYGFFQSTRYPWPGIELDKVQHDLVPLASAQDRDRARAERKRRLAAKDTEVRRLEGEKTATDRKLKETKGRGREGQAAKKRVYELTRALREAKKQRDRIARGPLSVEMAYAVAEGDNKGRRKVGNAHIQIKGDPERPGKEVPRHFPLVLGGQSLPSGVKGSGRLDLARWLTAPDNPLTARVMVNRIWQYHFGKGLVPTPSDFGRQGRPPTHPALLDYLARHFVESGWSVKAMHRLLMLSRTYQLSSADDEANARVDLGNDFLWHFSRHRLDAESIRDTLLAVSGNLDRSPGGPHPFPPQSAWNFTQHKPFKAVYDTNRRSVYLMTQRIQRHPFLALFDGPDTNASTAIRTVSTTPLQALYLMNDPFVHAQARQFAARLLGERLEENVRIDRAYALAFGRPPRPDERSGARAYLGRVRARLRADRVPAAKVEVQSWESLARALFLSNEFVYID